MIKSTNISKCLKCLHIIIIYIYDFIGKICVFNETSGSIFKLSMIVRMTLCSLKFCGFKWNLLPFTFKCVPLILTFPLLIDLSVTQPHSYTEKIHHLSLTTVHQHSIKFPVPSVHGVGFLLFCYLISASTLNFTGGYTNWPPSFLFSPQLICLKYHYKVNPSYPKKVQAF